jgi:acylphosphatase
MTSEEKARRYVVRGRVQGVGFRNFAQRAARQLGLRGWCRNRDDGTVEVFAQGSETALHDFEGQLYQGPRFADVRGVDRQEESLAKLDTFSIRH